MRTRLFLTSLILGIVSFSSFSQAFNIFGADNRVRMNGAARPWSAVGFLRLAYARSAWGCSGTLIDRNLVLTALHCFIDNGFVSGAGETTFSAGYTLGERPFGAVNGTPLFSVYSDITKPHLSDEQVASYGYLDWMVVRLDEPVGDVAGAIKVMSSQEFRQLVRSSTSAIPVMDAGYSSSWLEGERSAGVDLDCYLHEIDFARGALLHDCSIEHGASGSALLHRNLQSGLLEILGVTVSESVGPVESKDPSSRELRLPAYDRQFANFAVSVDVFAAKLTQLRAWESLRLSAIDACAAGYATSTLRKACGFATDEYLKKYTESKISQVILNSLRVGLFEATCSVPSRTNMNILSFVTESTYNKARLDCLHVAQNSLPFAELGKSLSQCSRDDLNCTIKGFENARQTLLIEEASTSASVHATPKRPRHKRPRRQIWSLSNK